MEVRVSETPIKVAAEALNEALVAYQDKPILLMVSGGSALGILDQIEESQLGPHITITTLDERFSTDKTVNNFAQLAATGFYATARARGAQEIATTITPADTFTEAGERFVAALRNWRERHPDGVVLATMGVGPDGHTAGIFPEVHSVAFDTDDWVMAYEVPETVNQYRQRITVTYTFLRNEVTWAVAYVVGAQKRAVVEALRQPSCPLKQLPACIIAELPAVLVTDQR